MTKTAEPDQATIDAIRAQVADVEEQCTSLRIEIHETRQLIARLDANPDMTPEQRAKLDRLKARLAVTEANMDRLEKGLQTMLVEANKATGGLFIKTVH